MSDEVRHLLRRGSGSPQVSWGFQQVWRRSQNRRKRRVASRLVITAALIAAATFGVTSITFTRNENAGIDSATDGPNRISPFGATRWEVIPAAPIKARAANVAAWTGDEFVVWGGYKLVPGDKDGQVVDGAAFDPHTKMWRVLSAGPLNYSWGRTGIWTGEEMLVWGGESDQAGKGMHRRPDNGAGYDPESDGWTELPRSPVWSLTGHSAVWTGEEMVVWGGLGMSNQGAVYEPGSGSWRTISKAPIQGRHSHSAVWTGTEVIVWGGRVTSSVSTGAAYNLASDTWRELPPAPISGRDLHAAVWTGDEMIVWGGWNIDIAESEALSDGAAYNPSSNTWRKLPRAPISAAISQTTGIWTGREVVIVGKDGAIAAYTPRTNEWEKVSDPPSGAVEDPSLLIADDRLILWGGFSEEGSLLRLDE
jgi:N-acetylneuraminic acid mutarotase